MTRGATFVRDTPGVSRRKVAGARRGATFVRDTPGVSRRKVAHRSGAGA